MEELSGLHPRLKKGNIIKISKNGNILFGTITYTSIESERKIYDYEDQYGNFSWCYAEQIISVIQ